MVSTALSVVAPHTVQTNIKKVYRMGGVAPLPTRSQSAPRTHTGPKPNSEAESSARALERRAPPLLMCANAPIAFGETPKGDEGIWVPSPHKKIY